jgi:hypothetical protein
MKHRFVNILAISGVPVVAMFDAIIGMHSNVLVVLPSKPVQLNVLSRLTSLLEFNVLLFGEINKSLKSNCVSSIILIQCDLSLPLYYTTLNGNGK